MIRQSRKRLHDVPLPKLIPLIELLCHDRIEVSPIYECVKVFARVRSDGQMTYARHASDLGTITVTAHDIVSRFKDAKISATVSEALQAVEENLLPCWPFSPGSSSWIQLEILDNNIKMNGPTNEPSIVVRKAVRISRRKKDVSMSTTPLVERMFSRLKENLPEAVGRFKVVWDPKIQLKNISGTGIMVESLEQSELGVSPAKIAEAVACQLISENLEYEPFISPGFTFVAEGEEYRVTSCTYGTLSTKSAPEKKVLPLPIVGVVR